MFNILDRIANIKEVDCGVKNKFSWKWLEDDHGDFLSEYVRKIDLAGFAVCQWCKNSKIKYGASCKKDLKQHARTAGHRKIREERRSMPALPAIFSASRTMIKCSGILENSEFHP
jgi:hypothetical protein